MLAGMSPISYRSLPLRLYQITQKFRDEQRPRYGLLRTKEFLMKDLYTFDASMEAAKQTYDEVNVGYANLFHQIGIEAVKIEADAGMMGGNLSHEYHYLTEIGEDTLVRCADCGVIGSDEATCIDCGGKNLVRHQGIEVAHTFILGDKYSRPLQANFLQSNGKPAPMVMGCYGIGVTRLIAAALEVKSKADELRWPMQIAPFMVCFIPPKSGSKEEIPTRQIVQEILKDLEPFDLIVDDRALTIGKRLYEAKRLGYPFIVVSGELSMQNPPKFEFHDLERELVTQIESSELLNLLQTRINGQ